MVEPDLVAVALLRVEIRVAEAGKVEVIERWGMEALRIRDAELRSLLPEGVGGGCLKGLVPPEGVVPEEARPRHEDQPADRDAGLRVPRPGEDALVDGAGVALLRF